MSDKRGKVYLAGSGPGDPGLLTLRTRELLERCDCLVYDALITAPILRLANPEAERIYVGKRGGKHSAEQPDINGILAQKASAGLQVLRLKGGDPYLFGRGAEEAQHLRSLGVEVEVIPGVTAGIAAPAYAGIPVTHREHASAVAFVTGHEDPAKPETMLDYEALSKIGTLCFYMGVKNLQRICDELRKYIPASTPVAVIQWGTTPQQRSVSGTLETIVEHVRTAGIEAPALTVVGSVVALRDELNFFERRPLFGKRILITRSRAQASDLAEQLEALGAQCLTFPTIRIAPPADPEPLRKAVAALHRYDWVILTSVNGVDALFEALQVQGRDARAFGSAKVAAIGSATVERLKKYGIRADLQPPKFVAESIVASLEAEGIFTKGELRFLLPRADIARSELPKLLLQHMAQVDDVEAYRTLLETIGQEEAIEAIVHGQLDAITFTSGSTVRNFIALLGKDKVHNLIDKFGLRCFSIGPITSEAMREYALPIAAEASEHNIPGLIETLCNAFHVRRQGGQA